MDSPPSVDNTVICKDLDWDTDSLGSLCIFRAVGKSIKCPSQEGVSLALTFLLPKNRLRVCCRRVPMYLDHATPWLALAVSRLVSFPRMRSYLGMWAAVLCYLCSPASSGPSFSKSKPVKKGQSKTSWYLRYQVKCYPPYPVMYQPLPLPQSMF